MLERLKSDLIKAMKEQDKVTLTTLRAVKGTMQMEIINNKKVESDELVLDVITKEIKLRNDSIAEFTKANRQDLIDSYQQEIDILKKYLPEQLSDEEINTIIDETFLKVNPTSIKDLGLIMKEITPKVKNKCDMKSLNEKIREKLNS